MDTPAQRLLQHCEAVLRLPGDSTGADQDVAIARERGLPVRGSVLQVSGRASFELVQKAALAGVATLSAVSAPSSLAAELAEEVGMTLLGFNRGSSLNVYTGRERVAGPPADGP